MNRIEFGDCRETMRRWAADGVRVQTCVTSPPYFGLRDYGHPGQIGLEQTPEQYIAAMVEVFRCVRDVLAADGTLWLNIGDSYGAGKQQLGIPWRVALALQSDGWVLRQDIIWHKPNPMPESVRDRCTKAHEYIFLLSKSERYFFDSEAMKEPAVSEKPAGNKRHKYADAYAASEGEEHRTKAGLLALTGVEWEKRNRRSVWTVATRPYKGAHFATFPPALIEPCVLAGSRPGDIVLDPFMGSGTTAAVALRHGRQYLGCELNPEYGPLQEQRISLVQTDAITTMQRDLFTTELRT
jgi:DNA modification methylase